MNISKNENSIKNKKINYIKKNNYFFIKENNEIIYYSELIQGTDVFTNYVCFILLFLFGMGFIIIGFSSYFYENKINFFLENLSNIKFLPQGILLIFYGACSLFLSLLIGLLININIGSGKNEFDIKNKIVRITRKGFPILTKNLKFKQKNIYFVYPFSDLLNLELEIIEGINPNRVTYLILKDGRRIPITTSNKLENLLSIESKAIYIAKLLKIDLKLSDKIY
jgi:hypothetical protein